MSYILDALKRADSERVRGNVPTLRDQPMTASSNSAELARSGMARTLALGAGAVAVAVAAGLAWRLMAPDVPETPAPAKLASNAPAETPPSPVAQAVGKAQLPVAEPKSKKSVEPLGSDEESAPPQAASKEPSRQASSPSDTEGKLRAAMAPAEISPAERAPESAKPRAQSVAKPQPKPEKLDKEEVMPSSQMPGMAVDAIAAQSQASSKPNIVALADLPQAVRQRLPKLIISGATYSDNPAWRMLIINGQVFHEGEKPAADVQLEQIRPKSAVLNYKGQRFTQSY